MKNFLVYVKINGIMTNRIVVAESAERIVQEEV